MKKLTAIIIALSTAAVLCSCGSVDSNKNSAEKAEKSEVVTTAPNDDIVTETFTLPSRETFAKVPDEASQSFDYVIRSVKKTYPVTEKGATRLYGYLGEEDINECKCYIFAVYDKKEDVHTEVATVAVTEDSSEIYVYNSELSVYESLETSENDSSSNEYHWAETANTSEDVTDSIHDDVTLSSETEALSDDGISLNAEESSETDNSLSYE